MKKLVYIYILLLFACNGEDANNCFQASGTIIQEVVEVSNFERILVNRDIELILKEAPEHKVIIETGENLINDVKAEVVGNQLVLTDSNNCNFVRDYGITKIYVSAPNIIEIRSSTQYDISSEGVLSFSSLNLFSDDFFAPDTYTSGDFRLSINSDELRILTNNLSSQYVTGSVNELHINFASGAGRFEGADLIAQKVVIAHRGSNDMIVNPQQSLVGQLRGTGDLISVNEPPIVDVEKIYTGQLIFN
ncbi:MAG: DUF2807 domain-containing protein [Winogradskyella sp.]|nr:DUF2807 domain-containing protein [Winogradskyella sp.]